MNRTDADLSRLRLCVTGSFGFNDIGDEAMLAEDQHDKPAFILEP